jgi:hypothetical protein
MMWALGCLAALLVTCGFCGGAAFFLKGPLLSPKEASQTAKAYLKDHPLVRQEIGEIRGYGDFPNASYRYDNGEGEARLVYQLRGDKGEGRATLRLVKPKGKGWEVAAARLETGTGTFTLKEGVLEPEPAPPPFPAPPLPPEDPGTQT